MSNPFRKADALRRFFALIVIVAFSFSFCPVAMAQGDFDFSDDESLGGDDFNFEEEAPAPLELEKKFVMPNNGKPVNLVIFEPVDGTPEKTLDQLTESTVELLKDEKYAQYDSVEGIPVKEKLGAMNAEDRMVCVDDAECLSNIGREIGAANIIVGRIYTENRDRPQITFDLIEMSSSSNKNSIFFDTQNRLRKQEQDISGALLRLFNIDTGSIDSLITQKKVEESAPLPLGQLISGIIVGVVALGAIGTGIYFGVTAKKLDSDVGDAIELNRVSADSTSGDFTILKNQGKLQNDVKSDHDKASDYAMIANIMYASGAVLAVVSVILFLVRSDKDEDIFANDLYLSPSVGTDGGGVVAGFTF